MIFFIEEKFIKLSDAIYKEHHYLIKSISEELKQIDVRLIKYNREKRSKINTLDNYFKKV